MVAIETPISIDVVPVTEAEAVYLLRYHLRMAMAYYEACPMGKGFMNDLVADFDERESGAANAFVNSLDQYFESIR